MEMFQRGLESSSLRRTRLYDEKGRMKRIPYDASAIGSIMYAMLCTRLVVGIRMHKPMLV